MILVILEKVKFDVEKVHLEIEVVFGYAFHLKNI